MLSISYILKYKHLVSFANLIITLTTLISGFQRLIRPLIFLPPPCLRKQPSNIYNRSLNRSPQCSLSLILYYTHLLQKKRKCYIDSVSPQSHNTISNTLILQRYSFRNDLPIYNYTKIAVLKLINYWYSPTAFLR